jgi:CelD/BcsL family acetyltransferase involved in cellulose biosynthesis
MTSVHVRILEGFEDPTFRPADWKKLLSTGSTDVVFLTPEWQRAWWMAYGRGRLMLLLAEVGGEAVALMPLFTDEGMGYLVGSGGSDYLDIVGRVDDAEVLGALLSAAKENISGFIGFVFYHLRSNSGTNNCLPAVAEQLGLRCFGESDMEAPFLTLPSGPGYWAADKKSLVRHESYFRREGELKVTHLTSGAAILRHLPEFFAQHIARWQVTPHPSLFTHAANRFFYESLCLTASDVPWLRFTRLDWNGHPIAFHFGFSYRGVYMWYKPSFDINLARRSPGEVLLRQLLLAAAAEGATYFDFGLGTETFKRRFADRSATVHSWSLYDPGVVVATGAA